MNGLNASLATNGTVALHANTDFSFDFAGRTDQQPIVQSVTGTAAPAISGTFLGSSNSTCQAEIITGGEVGVSADVVVVVRVTDTATGNVIGDFNFGLGYAANQSIEIAEGISFSMTPGTLIDGDTFSVRVTQQPDET